MAAILHRCAADGNEMSEGYPPLVTSTAFEESLYVVTRRC